MEVIPPELRENISEIVSSPSFDWNVVPDYLRKYVAVFLRYNDILALCDTSKSVREEICEDDFFWEMKTRKDFRAEYDHPPWPRENWEEDYRFYMRKLERDLINAIKSQNIVKVKELIEFGVDISSKSGFNEYTPLMRALIVGSLELVKLLLENGAYVNAKTTETRFTALHGEAYEGNSDIVRLLLDYGADVKAKTSSGEEAIIFSYKNSTSLELVDMLLEKGADINNIGRHGQTLLINASTSHSGDYIQGLIDRGAKLNVQSGFGITPLIRAVFSKNPEAVRVLLDNGADTTIRNGRGNTVLDIVNGPGYTTPRTKEARDVRRMIREAFGEASRS